MPQVTDVKDVILFDPVLTQVAIGYRPQGAVAENLLPTLPVSSVSGQIARFGKMPFVANLPDGDGEAKQDASIGPLNR